MLAAEVISEVRRRGVTLIKDKAENSLRLRPASALTPQLVDELREHKAEIINLLSEPTVEAARDWMPGTPPDSGVKAGYSSRVTRGDGAENLPKHAIQQTCKADITEPWGSNEIPPRMWCRDPLAHRDTDKVRFFGGDWRSAEPNGWRRHG